MKKYNAHPLHILFPIVLATIGLKSIANGDPVWVWTGVIICLSSIGQYAMVVVAGTIPYYTEYWTKLLMFAEKAPPERNPELWDFLGVPMPQKTRVMVQVGEDKNYPAYDTAEPPVTDGTMTAIAYACIVGKKAFNERALESLVKRTEFRAVLKDFQGKGYVKKAKQGKGLVLSNAGRMRLYPYLVPSPSQIAPLKQEGGGIA